MKGLSFTAPRMRAWLEGRKTLTRRLMNPQPDHCHRDILNGEPYSVDDFCRLFPQIGDKEIKPTYRPGETVYIKETWVECDIKANDDDSESVFIVYKATNDMRPDGVSCENFGSGRWVMRPEGEIEKFRRNIERMEVLGTKWRSPRFMPEWAARSHALIVSVRPERVQEINEIDAFMEGFRFSKDCRRDAQLTDQFREVWESLHPGSWEKNEWCWVYTLKKLDK